MGATEAASEKPFVKPQLIERARREGVAGGPGIPGPSRAEGLPQSTSLLSLS